MKTQRRRLGIDWVTLALLVMLISLALGVVALFVRDALNLVTHRDTHGVLTALGSLLGCGGLFFLWRRHWRVIGATAVGLTQHVGVLRGLIQNRTRLGRWKAILLEEPLRFPEAYVACSQQSVVLAH